MQAIVTPTYGPPEVLSMSRLEAPAPGPGEILVAVRAAAVTRGDDRLRGAEFPGATAILGRSLFGFSRPRKANQGSMFSGEVVGLGAGVERFSVGDRVFGEVSHGAYAELLVVRADASVAHMPEGVDHAQVAALPYGAVTAWVFLNDLARVQPGEHVVIIGAGGGVGRYAIQIARHLGAEVTAVASARHDAMLDGLALGTGLRRVRDASEITGRVDVVLDTSASAQRGQWLEHLGPSGRFLTTDLSLQLLLDLVLSAVRSGPRVLFGIGGVTADNLAIVADLVETGALRPLVAERFPFDDIVSAHRAVHRGGLSGDVIVEVA